jgi:TonB family protein
MLCRAAVFVFVFVVLLMTACLSAQENRTTSSALKVCRTENPPPCADTAPRITHYVDPKYTDEARKLKVRGSVLLYLVVGTDGRAHDIRVVRPLGHGLDEEAVKAAEQWKFAPGADHGTPVPVELNAEAVFRIY